jgi:hypothetical protein
MFYIDQTKELRKIDPLELEDFSSEQIIQYIYDKQANSPIPFYYFLPIFGFFGIGIGALVYYLMAGDLEKKEVVIKHNTDIIIKLLDPDEQKVIRKIVENEGKLQQIEITYMEGFTKVKSHRIIESLVIKGILNKEKLGKMRLITMNKDLLEILKK